jgi:MYXO-CTERM domain-containing protein
MKTLAAVLLPLLALAAVDVREAEACSQPACWTGYFTPGDGATVPANLPAIVWRPVRNSITGEAPDPTKVSLSTAAGVTVPLTGKAIANGDWVFTIDKPLSEGVGYVLRDLNLCVDQVGPTAAFTAAAAAPLPTELGALTTNNHRIGTLEVGTSSGSCSVTIEVDQVGVEVSLPAATQPWRDVLLYETLVDGTSWRPERSIRQSLPAGESWFGRGADRVYKTCSTPDQLGSFGLAEGPHEVAMQATLAGTSLALSAAALTVELGCAPPKDACETTVAADGTCEPAVEQGGCSTGGATGLGALGLIALAMAGRRGNGRRKRQ